MPSQITISNLVIQNNATNPNYQLDISADEIDIEGTRISDYSETVDITVSGAGGLDTGAEAANTWYYVWAIAKEDFTVSSLLSLSSTTPTMPSGYTKKRRVGAIRNNASSNFLEITQDGSWVSYWLGGNLSVLVGGRATSSTDVDCSTYIPTTSRLGTFNVISDINNYGAGVGNTIRVHPKGASSNIGQISIISFAQVLNLRFRHEKIGNVITDSSQVIQYKCDSDPNIGCVIVVEGYYDRI